MTIIVTRDLKIDIRHQQLIIKSVYIYGTIYVIYA